MLFQSCKTPCFTQINIRITFYFLPYYNRGTPRQYVQLVCLCCCCLGRFFLFPLVLSYIISFMLEEQKNLFLLFSFWLFNFDKLLSCCGGRIQAGSKLILFNLQNCRNIRSQKYLQFFLASANHSWN